MGYIKPLGSVKCVLAENPLWISRENCIYWTDIPKGKIYRIHLKTNLCEIVYTGDPVGGFTEQEDGSLLLFRVNDIVLMNRKGRLIVRHKVSLDGAERFNDVIADPKGRVFAGTIGKTKNSGGIYRIDLDGAITELFTGTGCSNGMGFSPDLKTFYWTCSTTGRIYRFDYEIKSGKVSNRQLFYEALSKEGIPDGMTVDRDGFVWSARWGGGSICLHDQKGRVLRSISIPERNITSMCFGGPNLDMLYVTAASDSKKKVQALYCVSHTSVGKPEFFSRIQ